MTINAVDRPRVGWYRRKLVKGGPYVPARIWLDAEIDDVTGELLSDEKLQCEVNGQWADPEDAWQWLCSNPITEAEYHYMMAVRAHSAWHAPSEPQANPRAPIDWLRASPPIFSSTGKENP